MVPTDHLLFETDHGRVFQCAHFGRLVLTFKDYWMVWNRDGFVRFRNQVVRLAVCPLGRKFLADRGLRLVDGSGSRSLVLNASESEELVWLLDSAHYMLYLEEKAKGHENAKLAEPSMVCTT